MSDSATLLLVIVLALLIVGAFRLDALRQLWREWLKLGEQGPSAMDDLHQDHAHGAYGPGQPSHPQAQQHQPRRSAAPPFHRSGRRH